MNRGVSLRWVLRPLHDVENRLDVDNHYILLVVVGAARAMVHIVALYPSIP